MDIANLFSKKDSCRLLVNPEGELAERYKWYREFLVHNHEALQIISELERIQQDGEPFTIPSVEAECRRLFEAASQLVHALNHLSGGRYEALIDATRDIRRQVEAFFNVDRRPAIRDWVIPLQRLTLEMADIAGSKATQLAAVGNQLGLPVPDGFVITANAFWTFIEKNELYGPIEKMLEAAVSGETGPLESSAGTIQERIMNASVPSDIEEAILRAYDDLEAKTHYGVLVAVRSTAVGEDTELSFAGQYATILNVGRSDLQGAYKRVLASKYSPRAIRYRMRSGLDDRSTPMCVAAITMIDARSSGVSYSRDPADPEGSDVLVSAIWGLGEQLVSGKATPDLFRVNRHAYRITGKEINEKPQRLVLSREGGTRLEETPEEDRGTPAIDDETAVKIAQYSVKLETHFGKPQDVEWCVDHAGGLFILQSRLLGLSQSQTHDSPEPKADPAHPVLISAGKTASRGTASGRVVLASDLEDDMELEDAILVAKTASPEYAKLADSLRGIITDLGSTASHLASVARELGIPMIVSTQDATSALSSGAIVTMWSDTATVYEGRMEDVTEGTRLPRDEVFKSPVHQLLNAILSKISPLNLTDPDASTFTPQYCNTIHDVIRYSHEKVIKEMFGLSEKASDSITSIKMSAGIPLAIYFVDLGGGLKEDLTDCDEITPDAITSLPMKALWRGLSHPGIDWAGAVDVNTRNLMALMTSGPPPQMASYAVVSTEYVNLSLKFGYHYTTVDILWSDTTEDNYISLQFGGGAGSYHGRTMRIHFLSEVLQELGFMVQISGDVLDATVKGYDADGMEETIDQLGRLLASSRLLDLGISNPSLVDSIKSAFFSGDYNFLKQTPAPLPGFYTPTGDWTCVESDGRKRCLQDGTQLGDGFSCTFKNIMGKVVGFRYQRFLDTVHAYHYFPLAIMKDSYVGDASIQVGITPESGCINIIGGLVFGLRNAVNFFVLSLDALENRVSLLEFIKGKPTQHMAEEKVIQPRRTYGVAIQVTGTRVVGSLDGETVLQFDAQKPVAGYVGLWAKADAKVYFDGLTLQEADMKRVASC